MKGARAPTSRPLFEPLENAGFAWFSIDYRMAPQFKFQQANEDLNNAIRWVKKHAAEYHVDASKIALIGESAGGFLVNYAGTQRRRKRAWRLLSISMVRWITGSLPRCGGIIPSCST